MKAKGGRLPAYDREADKRRNVVERCFNRLKQFRAGVELASLVLWLRELST